MRNISRLQLGARHLALLCCICFAISCPGADALDSWFTRMSTNQRTLNSVAYGNGRFIAVGQSGTILLSSNGASWTGCNSGTLQNLSGVVYGSNTFVAVGNHITLTSRDGIVWTNQVANAYAAKAVAYGAGISLGVA